jgi:hypothetical protein
MCKRQTLSQLVKPTTNGTTNYDDTLLCVRDYNVIGDWVRSVPYPIASCYRQRLERARDMTPILYILGTTLSVAFILLGWNIEGYLSQLCIIIGSMYFGHILTEALNYVERE